MNGKDFLVRAMKGKDGAIAMIGMVNREVTKMNEELEVDLGGGLDRRSGIRFLSLFICWTAIVCLVVSCSYSLEFGEKMSYLI